MNVWLYKCLGVRVYGYIMVENFFNCKERLNDFKKEMLGVR